MGLGPWGLEDLKIEMLLPRRRRGAKVVAQILGFGARYWGLGIRTWGLKDLKIRKFGD